MANIYEQGLDRNPANYTPITPLLFLERSAQIYPNKIAVIHGKLRQTWQQTYERCLRLASALQKHGIGLGVTAEEMIAYCKEHLAGFKVPRAIVFCELPKTSTGKIQKFELRKLAGSATAIDV